MASITLNHIGKTYPGGVTAVRDTSLEIEDKEFVVLVGPSGCGKTTTLRMIAGLEEITRGDLLIDGVRVNDLPPKNRDIAMVFQNYALYPHMSVYDNMAFGLKLKKMPKKEIDARVREAARILDITEYLDRKPRALSGGQRQRVALGRAIVRQPKVFLMDEPLSNLDAKLRTQTRTEILSLWKKLDTTFVYVTHDQTEAMTMGTRIVVMDQGEVQQVDTPINVFENPANLFVAGFIGCPQMNFLPAVLHSAGESCRVSFGGRSLDLPGHRYQGEPPAAGGRPVILGIRPEHFLPAAPGEGYRGDVILTEMLGSESYVHMELEGQKVLARMETEEVEGQEDLYVLPDPRKALLFDPDSGINLQTS